MRYRYALKGLDCANCAREVEEYLSSQEDLSDVIVNFSTLKLSFTTTRKEGVQEYIQRLVNNVEPDVVVLEDSKSYTHNSDEKYDILRLFIGIIFMLCTFFLNSNTLCTLFTILAYIVLLSKTFIEAIKLLLKGTINESLLITISCIGAYLIGERIEGLMVIILYEIGEVLEERAINKSRKSISSLINIKPEYATKENGDIVSPETLNMNDIIIIKPGEKVPIDGTILEGKSHLDVSSLTGESKLIEVKKDDKILSGSINSESVLKVLVTDTYQNSTVFKILDLVENATDKKTKTETYVNKVSKIYTPIVIILAILVAILLPLFTNLFYDDSIYRALTFLVISCPCAIAISVPLSYFSGIGISSKHGILIKGSDYLDNLSNIKEVVFDKTGTLTTGIFGVTDIVCFNNYSKDDILRYAVLGESLSNHPIAKSIVNYYDKQIDTSLVLNYKEIPGKGIIYTIDNKSIKVGNALLVDYEDEEKGNIFVSIDSEIMGYICINDIVKDTSKLAIKLLNNKGIKTSMFTGDNYINAKRVADELSITDYKYSMLPVDKYNELEKKQTNYSVAFVGDGINDAPVLALSNIGISMGLTGTGAAIETSDIVIMTDDLTKINKAIDISKFTNKIIKQNLFLAFLVKIIILLLSVFGISSMWHAIFADVGVTLITIFNTLRILRIK